MNNRSRRSAALPSLLTALSLTIVKALCHCLQCQRVTGSAYTSNILVPRDSFKIVTGTPKKYTFTQSDSGIPFTISFCGECSSVVNKQSDDEAFKAVTIVPAGSVDGNAGIEFGKPDAELWVTHRASWVGETAGAAQVQGFA
jgi:hypothetical protein